MWDKPCEKECLQPSTKLQERYGCSRRAYWPGGGISQDKVFPVRRTGPRTKEIRG